MMTLLERARELARRLSNAVHGRGGLDDKLVLVGVVGGVLFVSLVATLVFVQQRLGAVADRMIGDALPAEQQIAQLESSVGAAFGRQAQVSSTLSTAQLEPLRDRSGVEAPLRAAAHELARLPEASGLIEDVDAFLAADDELFGAVERKHQLQHQFETELTKIDGDLRALVEDSQAVAGHLRLEYVLVLRGIAGSLDGGVRTDLVRTAVLGDVRGALDDTSELANSVLALGRATGQLGLAASSDAINSLAANELPQIRTRIERLIGALDGKLAQRPEARTRASALAQRFDDIAPRILDDKRDGSLVALRRKVVSEAEAAIAIRAAQVAAAARLTAVTAGLHAAMAAQVDVAAHASSVTRDTARFVSIVIVVLGVLGCMLAGKRITGGLAELEATNRRLTDLKLSLESLNASLEYKVASRTEALVARDRAMQRVLDSMDEGLATVSLDGRLRSERSKAFTAWFGDAADRALWQLLFPADAERAASYAIGFQQIVDDFLPFEVAVGQLPERLERDGRCFKLELRPVHEHGKLDAVLLVARDITAELAALKAEGAAREDHKLLANLLRDRRGFRRSVEDIENLIATARDSDDRLLRGRALHTLKGNAGVLGFAALARQAHTVEDELEQEGGVSDASFAALEHSFSESMRRFQALVSDARDRIDVDARDYGKLIDQLKHRAAYDEILALVEAWQREPVDNLLADLANHARRMAEQMGKRLQVQVEGNGIRIVDDGLRSFCGSLVHAIRNAVDHGIEAPEDRAARGKRPTGLLRLSASVADTGALVVSVADDGNGVDLERVRAKARAAGLPHHTDRDVLEALFCDGLTTRDQVSELSGRGVGTSAVRAACRELGGDAQLLTIPSRGTELRCTLPATVLASSKPRPRAPGEPANPMRITLRMAKILADNES